MTIRPATEPWSNPDLAWCVGCAIHRPDVLGGMCGICQDIKAKEQTLARANIGHRRTT